MKTLISFLIAMLLVGMTSISAQTAKSPSGKVVGEKSETDYQVHLSEDTSEVFLVVVQAIDHDYSTGPGNWTETRKVIYDTLPERIGVDVLARKHLTPDLADFILMGGHHQIKDTIILEGNPNFFPKRAEIIITLGKGEEGGIIAGYYIGEKISLFKRKRLEWIILVFGSISSFLLFSLRFFSKSGMRFFFVKWSDFFFYWGVSLTFLLIFFMMLPDPFSFLESAFLILSIFFLFLLIRVGRILHKKRKLWKVTKIILGLSLIGGILYILYSVMGIKENLWSFIGFLIVLLFLIFGVFYPLLGKGIIRGWAEEEEKTINHRDYS